MHRLFIICFVISGLGVGASALLLCFGKHLLTVLSSLRHCEPWAHLAVPQRHTLLHADMPQLQPTLPHGTACQQTSACQLSTGSMLTLYLRIAIDTVQVQESSHVGASTAAKEAVFSS